MASPVELVGLTRRFPGSARASVDGIDLRVEAGEVVCLVGPSGCGKSTTLRMVAGLDLPDAGQIRIAGRDVAQVPPQARDVAMVFQGFALYPHMTVREILGFPLKLRKVDKGARERRVNEVAELLAITKLLDRRPPGLSGGEQQRVAMGRAIVRRPEVFLFDEPLSNLDAALRAELRVELGKLLGGLGATALYVTHDQAEAMTLGRRIAVLRDGRIEQCATPREIYERPATRFVAGFFGTPPMNLAEARREGDVLCAAGLRLSAPSGVGTSAIFGVRPEHLRLGGGGPTAHAAASEDVHGTARVVAIEPLGADTHVELDAHGVALRMRVAGFDAPAVGETLTFRFSSRDARWFDAETGLAISGDGG